MFGFGDYTPVDLDAVMRKGPDFNHPGNVIAGACLGFSAPVHTDPFADPFTQMGQAVDQTLFNTSLGIDLADEGLF